MSERRRWGVIGLLLVLVVGHLAAGWEDQEWWPLSNYALYAREYRWRDRVVPVAEGLTAGGDAVPLDAAVLQPLDDGRIERLLRQTDLHTERADLHRARELAAGLAGLYRLNRESGRHDGPPLASVRVVLETRKVLADARNARGPADARRVVLDVPVRSGRP